ncbi:MAG: hypothetical protein UY63_C0015G0012 [Parcubacteria group bacterium GW2011_GWA2_51_10]|nr:MAG: hypothetical protein UY63_C0015G0012 [Parcubacteria group bacterium GW2011_GWA2_51_10]
MALIPRRPPATSSDDVAAVHGAAVTTQPRSLMLRIMLKIPWFTWVLLLYVLLELSVSNMRAVIFTIGPYALTWVEVIYLIASGVAMIELLTVAEPGVDNVKEAVLMLAAGIVYLVLFVLGTASVYGLAIFNNTEFLWLLLLVSMQVVMGFVLNARTLQRTFQAA